MTQLEGWVIVERAMAAGRCETLQWHHMGPRVMGTQSWKHSPKLDHRELWMLVYFFPMPWQGDSRDLGFIS